ncbi:MAG: hypothetical protein ACYDG4_16575 [Desulfuromonadaceae bacterium]
MTKLLRDLEGKWKESGLYKDVEASYWVPGQFQVNKCPKGCELSIHKKDDWAQVDNIDAYRQTRICRAHGFARIYVITGPAAELYHWSPHGKKRTLGQEGEGTLEKTI